MTGLSMVVLIIGLASAIFSSASEEQPVATAGSPRSDVVTNMTIDNALAPVIDPNHEPLADLGVAPTPGILNATVPAAR